jgi:hypothetical protein
LVISIRGLFGLPGSLSKYVVLLSARRFAEFFVGHSAKNTLPSGVLGKSLLSVTNAFTESRTLIGTDLCRVPNTRRKQRSVKNRQQPSIADDH